MGKSFNGKELGKGIGLVKVDGKKPVNIGGL